MQNFLWIILLVLLLVSGTHLCVSTCTFWRRYPDIGKWSLDGLLLFTFLSNGIKNCSVMCDNNQPCGFFSYSDQTGICSGFSAIAAGNREPSTTLPITGMVFHQGESNIFVNDSVSGLSIRISNIYYSRQLAADTCSEKGERLVVLDTLDKRQRIAALLKILETVMERQVARYWIGLSYDIDNDIWKWDNGKPLNDPSPLTNTLAQSNGITCGVIKDQTSLYNDMGCGAYLKFICEKL